MHSAVLATVNPPVSLSVITGSYYCIKYWASRANEDVSFGSVTYSMCESKIPTEMAHLGSLYYRSPQLWLASMFFLLLKFNLVHAQYSNWRMHGYFSSCRVVVHLYRYENVIHGWYQNSVVQLDSIFICGTVSAWSTSRMLHDDEN